MESVKKQAFRDFDYLTKRDQSLVYEFIKRLSADDVATPEDIAAHAAAMKDYERGECVRHEDINWD